MQDLFKISMPIRENDRVIVPQMPSPEEYPAWRDSSELAVVSASGRILETAAWFSEIEDQTTVVLAKACPEKLRSVDAKFACSVRAVLKGNAGRRIAFEIKKLGDAAKFSGRVIVKIMDKEFGYKCVQGRAGFLAEIYRLRLKTLDVFWC